MSKKKFTAENIFRFLITAFAAMFSLYSVIMLIPSLGAEQGINTMLSGISQISVKSLFLSLAGIIAVTAFFTALLPFIKEDAPKREKGIYFTIILLLSLFFTLNTPYLPCHDSLLMHEMIGEIITGDGFNKYHETYLYFYSAHRIIVEIYCVFARLFNDVTTGVRALNTICIVSSVFLTALMAANLSGKKYMWKSAAVICVLFPYFLASGPYAYPIAIFMLSLSGALLSSKSRAGKIIGVIMAALLYVVRPTAFVCIFVFIAVRAFLGIADKKQFIKQIAAALLIFVCGIAAKEAVGFGAYKSGMHLYPRLNSSAMLWEIELGTRLDGADTGVCSYTSWSLGDKENDPVAKEFNKIWQICKSADKTRYNELLQQQNKIKGMLFERVKNEIFASPASFGKFILYKTLNYYGNRYISYYSKTNINSPDFAKSLYNNYDIKNYMSMNTGLLLFFVFTLASAIGVWKNKDNNKNVLCIGVSGAALAAVMILVTEVTKKYTLDFYVPVMAVSAYGMIKMSEKYKKADIKQRLCILILAVLIMLVRYNYNNISGFEDIEYTIEPVNEEKSELVIKLDKECKEDYIIKTTDGEISCYGKKEVNIPIYNGDFDAFEIGNGVSSVKVSAEALKYMTE